ncbi:MAG: nucleotidyltransferase family protein [Candidatus Methylumidiphilus sp.]
MHPLIHEHRNAIAERCQRYRVQRLEVFGSAARGTDFDPETSDADFLVEFSTASKSPSLKAFFGLQTDLSKVLGRTVDLAEASAIRTLCPGQGEPYPRGDLWSVTREPICGMYGKPPIQKTSSFRHGLPVSRTQGCE